MTTASVNEGANGLVKSQIVVNSGTEKWHMKMDGECEEGLLSSPTCEPGPSIWEIKEIKVTWSRPIGQQFRESISTKMKRLQPQQVV